MRRRNLRAGISHQFRGLNVESGKLPARWQWVARIGKETRWLDMPSTSPDRKIGKGEEERNAVDQGRLVEGSQS